MTDDVHVHIHMDSFEGRLDRIDNHLRTINDNIGAAMADLSRLTAEVTESITVQQGAIALLNNLSDLLRAAATDPVEINALADQLDAEGNALAAAIQANTPTQPT